MSLFFRLLSILEHDIRCLCSTFMVDVGLLSRLLGSVVFLQYATLVYWLLGFEGVKNSNLFPLL